MSTPSGVWAAGMGAPAGSKQAHHGTTMLQSEEAVLVDFRGQLCLGQWNPENLGPSCSLLGFSKRCRRAVVCLIKLLTDCYVVMVILVESVPWHDT
jgi:hypothetical protein